MNKMVPKVSETKTCRTLKSPVSTIPNSVSLSIITAWMKSFSSFVYVGGTYFHFFPFAFKVMGSFLLIGAVNPVKKSFRSIHS